ncbi:MAG: hypothetical protein ACR2OX_00860 [Methyloligellaceae bacterium]
MIGPSETAKRQPYCVVSMLSRFSDAVTAFEEGRPLGPYLVDTLLDHVDLCPALQESPDSNTYAQLHQAVEKARRSAEVVVACPSAERDWAVNELRTAVTHAHECLDAWREKVTVAAPSAPDNAIKDELGRIGAARCPTCAFAENIRPV